MKQIKEIRCSGLSRPMTCAGSLFLEGEPQETNPAAEEGTAAGEYLQHLIEGTKPGTHAKNGVMFDQDMKFHCGEVYSEIMTRANPSILCETRIDWVTRSGIVIRGQYDISWHSEDTLYVEDLKYGWGIVDVKENWQLLGYAIGEVIRLGKPFRNVVFRIHQPRPHHEDGPTRLWGITYEQLIQYKEQIEARMDKIAGGLSELVTSAKCKYCPAAAHACTALNRALYNSVDVVLSEAKQDSINEKEISQQLDLLERVKDILDIKQKSLQQLAINRLRNGALIPNWVTQESLSDRKWKKSISPETIKALTGLNIIEEVMLSPAKAEKLGVAKELVAAYVDRHFLGMKLIKKDSSEIGNKIFGTNVPGVK